MSQLQRENSKIVSGQGVLSERDDLILRAVYDLHFLTAEQLCSLYFSSGSLTHVREILKNLSDGGYLQRLKMPSSQDGVKPFVYTLARLGVRYLKAAGFTEFARVSPSEHLEHSFLFLEHTLGVNDIIIATKLLSVQEPRYVLADFLHERVLKRKPVKVTTTTDGVMSIVPDLWLDIHIANTSRASIALEYDRDTVSPASWRRKIRGLLVFAEGAYQEAYGSESLTIAIATTGGSRRSEQIRSWIEHELEKAGRKQDSDLFLVTAVTEGEQDPHEFFMSRTWIQPFGKDPVALLAG
jgi:protein involved in plasmid replication-relaxation